VIELGRKSITGSLSCLKIAVPQSMGKEFKGFPQIDDPAFADQYGILLNMFEWLLESIMSGSGRVIPYSEVFP